MASTSDQEHGRPYAFVGEVRRFNQHYTAFARANWDPTCAAYGKRTKSPDEIARKGKSGYSRHDFALHAGAWTIARQKLEPEQGRTPTDNERVVEAQCGPEGRAGLTRRVKRAARLFGASLTGVTHVNPLWIYECDGEELPIELPDGVTMAIVMAISMDYEMIGTSPSAVAAAATANGYSRMAFATTCLVRYLTELGWRAIPSGNDTALSVPLAIDAGLGELGRHGLLITAPHGPRVRLCKVFTDAPLTADSPVSFGVREFCTICTKCVRECPSAAIPRGEMTASGPTPSSNPGVLKWHVNADRCLAFWRANGVSCCNCVRSCPFNKPRGWIHELARSFVRTRSSLADRALLFLDDTLKYGKQRDADEVLG